MPGEVTMILCDPDKLCEEFVLGTELAAALQTAAPEISVAGTAVCRFGGRCDLLYKIGRFLA